jgi:hypothetical protein
VIIFSGFTIHRYLRQPYLQSLRSFPYIDSLYNTFSNFLETNARRVFFWEYINKQLQHIQVQCFSIEVLVSCFSEMLLKQKLFWWTSVYCAPLFVNPLVWIKLQKSINVNRHIATTKCPVRENNTLKSILKAGISKFSLTKLILL